MKQIFKKSSFSIFFVVLGFVMFFSPFIILSYFNYPGGEDFAEAILSIKLGFSGHVRDLYTTWDGRYFSAILFALHPLSFYSFTLYKIAPILLFILLFFSIWGLIKVAFAEFLNTKHAFVLSILYFTLFLFQISSQVYMFYYYISSFIYGIAIVLAVLFVGALFSMYKQKKYLYRFLLLTLSCFLIFLSVGTMESLLIFLPIFLVIIFTYRLFYNKGMLLETGIVFFALLVAIFIHLTSPALYGQMSIDGEIGSFELSYILNSLLLSFEITNHFIVKEFLNNNYLLLLYTLFIIPTVFYLCEKNQRFKAFFNFPLIPSVSLIYIMLVLLSFPYFWALGSETNLYPKRLFNVIYFFFIAAWFISFSLITVKIYEKFTIDIKFNFQKITVVFSILFLLLVPTSKNWIETTQFILSGEAKLYQKEFENRITKLQNAGLTDTVEIFTLQHNNDIINSGVGLETNNDNWVSAYEEYFNVGSIIVKNKDE